MDEATQREEERRKKREERERQRLEEERQWEEDRKKREEERRKRREERGLGESPSEASSSSTEKKIETGVSIKSRLQMFQEQPKKEEPPVIKRTPLAHRDSASKLDTKHIKPEESPKQIKAEESPKHIIKPEDSPKEEPKPASPVKAVEPVKEEPKIVEKPHIPEPVKEIVKEPEPEPVSEPVHVPEPVKVVPKPDPQPVKEPEPEHKVEPEPVHEPVKVEPPVEVHHEPKVEVQHKTEVHHEEPSHHEVAKPRPTPPPKVVQSEAVKPKRDIVQLKIPEFFTQMRDVARQLGLDASSPRVVFMGNKGLAKAQLVEYIMGINLGLTGAEPVTIYFNLYHGSEARASVYGKGKAKQCNTNQVAATINEFAKDLQLSEKVIEDGIHVKLESPEFPFEVTLVLTIASDMTTSLNGKFIRDTINGNKGIVVFVDESTSLLNNQDDSQNAVSQLELVDPQFLRSLFVFTNFAELVKKIETGGVLPASAPKLSRRNRRLLVEGREVDGYFVSLSKDPKKEEPVPRQSIENMLRQGESLGVELDAQNLRTHRTLYSYLSFASLHNLHYNIWSSSWNFYKPLVPAITSAIYDRLGSLKLQVEKIEDYQRKQNLRNQRITTIKYFNSFIRTLQKLLEGSERVHAPLQGQTLHEETQDLGFRWEIPQSQDFGVDDVVDAINTSAQWSFTDTPLNGALQFKRLVAEFNAIMDKLHFPKNVTDDDIGNAGGINQQGPHPSYAYAGCQLACQFLHEQVKPIVEQFTQRALYILKRQVLVAESAVHHSQFGFKNYPFLCSYVNAFFNKFFDSMAHKFTEQINDAFVEPQTVYWLYSLESGEPVNKSELPSFADHKFEELKAQLRNKTLLLSSNLFIFSVLYRTEGLEDVEFALNGLTDSTLHELFKVDNQATTNVIAQQDKQQEAQDLVKLQSVVDTRLFYWPTF